jgi:hypothetical protein
MEWFKHATGSHEDPDISDAWDTFGDSGPVIFWTILEVFGAEYSHLKEGWLTLSIPYFERKMRRKFRKTEKVLEFFEKRERIYFRKEEQSISLTIPKFIKIASNWTIRPKDSPPVLPTEVPTEVPTAKEEEEKKNIKEKNIKKRKTPIPDDFEISDRVKLWAEKKKMNHLQEHLESFVISCRAKGYEYVDWDSAFMNAIRQNWARLEGMQKRSDPFKA